MKYRLMDLLECIKCGSNNLKLKIESTNDTLFDGFHSFIKCKNVCSFKGFNVDINTINPEECNTCYRKEIINGEILCKCGTSYPIRLGIPRFIPDSLGRDFEKIQKTFSYEWKMFRTGERNWGQDILHRKNLFLQGMNLTPRDLKNKLIFDAGCGSGLLAMEMANSFGMEVIALDLSFGIEKANSINKNCNVHFIQGSVLNPPIRENIFDFIYCAGVLVALPDTYAGFRSIVRNLKNKGRCFIWVYHVINKSYHKNDYQKMLLYNWIRKNITSRLHIKIQYYTYLSLMPVFLIKQKIEKLAGLKKDILTWREKMQSLFDMFSPIYQNRHTYEEITEMFKKEGFTNINITDIDPYGFGVCGDYNN